PWGARFGALVGSKCAPLWAVCQSRSVLDSCSSIVEQVTPLRTVIAPGEVPVACCPTTPGDAKGSAPASGPAPSRRAVEVIAADVARLTMALSPSVSHEHLLMYEVLA